MKILAKCDKKDKFTKNEKKRPWSRNFVFVEL